MVEIRSRRLQADLNTAMQSTSVLELTNNTLSFGERQRSKAPQDSFNFEKCAMSILAYVNEYML